MTELSYAALGERDFRILSLSPGKSDEPLRGELLVRPIDTYIDEASKHEGELPESADSYEAVSYVWGSDDKPRRIASPAGAEVAITENLYHCLRRIRLGDRPRLVWVDALCINQSDNREKESQIMLMHDIFVSARRVLAYLGEEADGSKRAVELIQKYWRINIPNPLNAGARAFAENLLSEPVPDAPAGREAELPPPGDEEWMAVSRFWNRPWFRRVWVVQEFILARDVLMICGDEAVNWAKLWPATVALEEPESPPWPLVNAAGEELKGAADLMANMAQRLRFYQLGSMRGNSDEHGHGDDDGHEHGGGCCGGHGGHDHGHDDGLDHGHDHEHDDDEEEDDKDAEDAEDGDDEEWESEDGDDSGRSTDLLSLLLSFREVEATDPRDLYFALLGLASDGDREEFRPDYSATFEQTALRFARTLLHEPFSEELLDHAGIADSLNGADFPSWIPDFRRPWRRMTVADAAESEAAGETDFDFGFDPNEADDVLLLMGVKVDTISHATDLPRAAHLHAEQPSLWVKRDMVTLSELLAGIPGIEDATYPTGETGVEAVLRTLTFFRTGADEADGHGEDGEGGNEVPMTTLKLAYRTCTAVEDDDLDGARPEREALRREIMLSGCTAKEAGEALEAAAQVLINRVFPMRAALDLVLARGGRYVGMVPEGCEAGDEVWMLKGCNAPFVLRRSAEREGARRIVGAAYVHGIMSGEAVEEGVEFEPVSIH
ncbi:Heterokaryon incompatibility protein 6, OR allele [Colletotrichum shisoi]|uniref:Heterokaryon incompatibility protein 6, OR allele n=1 Tax=Colletotrichum shisoi TaxID=2078593 RepID=A0A5Q4BMA8_9PEZI|nr:Heterokaryon incompatibility protein 6, OR allele [Colletotrichum shisoi]